MTLRSPLSASGYLLVTSFGLGRLRPAPGTWGSLPPVVVAGVLVALGMTPRGDGIVGPVVYHGVMAGIVLVFGFACLLWGNESEARFGEKDPSEIVADETAGMAVTLMCVPVGPATGLWVACAWLAGGFLAFRLMDIVKPPPARGLQRLPGGVGVLIDDLVAGFYAGLVVLVAAWAG